MMNATGLQMDFCTVETISSTKTQDQVTKRQLYLEHRVAFYVIVDPETNSIESLQAGELEYHAMQASNSLEFTLSSGCRLAITIDRVLR